MFSLITSKRPLVEGVFQCWPRLTAFAFFTWFPILFWLLERLAVITQPVGTCIVSIIFLLHLYGVFAKEPQIHGLNIQNHISLLYFTALHSFFASYQSKSDNFSPGLHLYTIWLSNNSLQIYIYMLHCQNKKLDVRQVPSYIKEI